MDKSVVGRLQVVSIDVGMMSLPALSFVCGKYTTVYPRSLTYISVSGAHSVFL